VNFGDREVRLRKGHEVLISDALKATKFDAKQPDDLYAWSNVRSEYEAAASYQTARSVRANGFIGAGGYGLGGASSPGWYWASGFDSYAWLPGSGAFFSPFGYGFYAPGAVAYAPVVGTPVYGGNWNGGAVNHGPWSGRGTNASVPVNPNRPPAVGTFAASPSANQAARAQAAQSLAAGGFHTAAGAPVATFSGSHMPGMSEGGHPGAAAANGPARGGPGWSGGEGAVGRGGNSMGRGMSAGGSRPSRQ